MTPSDPGMGNGIVANGPLGYPVGERSTLSHPKTRFSIARLGVSESVTRLQVPPRPPKKSTEIVRFRCFLFLFEAAKANGKKLGRPALTFPANWGTVYASWKSGEITAKTAMEMTDTKRTSFYKLVGMMEEE